MHTQFLAFFERTAFYLCQIERQAENKLPQTAIYIYVQSRPQFRIRIALVDFELFCGFDRFAQSIDL